MAATAEGGVAAATAAVGWVASEEEGAAALEATRAVAAMWAAAMAAVEESGCAECGHGAGAASVCAASAHDDDVGGARVDDGDADCAGADCGYGNRDRSSSSVHRRR